MKRVLIARDGEWFREFRVTAARNERRSLVHADSSVLLGAPCVGILLVSGDKKASTGTSLPAVSPAHARKLAIALLQAADEAEALPSVTPPPRDGRLCVKCDKPRMYASGYCLDCAEELENNYNPATYG